MISVIMPLYNNEKYVAEAIQSVINQSYTDWELIIINDASTDNSQQIAENISKTDTRISLINLKENKGVSYARNLGIKKSKGEYISFLDSDDLWDENFLKSLYTLLKNTNASFVASNFNIFYNSNLKNMSVTTNINLLNDFNSLILERKHRYELNFLYHISGVLINKKLLTKYNIYFPQDQRLFEDLLFLSKLLCITNLIIEKKPLIYYRQHPESVTHKKYTTEDFGQELIYLNRLKDFAIKHNKDIKLLNSLIIYRTYRNINSILKLGDISRALNNIQNYKSILTSFYSNNYFKLNDRLKCKFFLLQNKYILKLLKYL